MNESEVTRLMTAKSKLGLGRIEEHEVDSNLVGYDSRCANKPHMGSQINPQDAGKVRNLQ